MTFTIDKNSWTRVKLGDVVRNVNESVKDPASIGIDRTIGLEHIESGNFEVQGYGSLGEGVSFTRRVRPGQVLFGKRRAYLRKVAVASFDAVCSGDILVFEPKDERLDARFLPFLVSSDDFFDIALQTSAGSMSPRTSWKALAAYEFLLPTREEQHRLADLLWAVNNHLATLKSQALVLEATNTRNGFGKWLAERFRNAETAKFSEIFQVSSGSFLPAKNFTDGQIPVYGGNGIAGYHGKSNTENHAIIIGRVGAYCGNVHKVEAPAWITDNALIVKIKNPELFVSLDYIALLLKVLGLNTYASQTAQPSLSGKTLAECRVPFLPIEEQFQIQEVLNFIQATKSAMEFEAQNLASFAMEIQFSIFGGSDVR